MLPLYIYCYLNSGNQRTPVHSLKHTHIQTHTNTHTHITVTTDVH